MAKSAVAKAAVKSANNIVKVLRKMCPKAHQVSLFHLAIAIHNNYKYFCTSEKPILRKKKSLLKKFKIEIITDPFVDNSGNTFNYYL